MDPCVLNALFTSRLIGRCAKTKSLVNRFAARSKTGNDFNNKHASGEALHFSTSSSSAAALQCNSLQSTSCSPPFTHDAAPKLSRLLRENSRVLLNNMHCRPRTTTAAAARKPSSAVDFDETLIGGGSGAGGSSENLKDWQILASVCLERAPVVSQTPLSIERAFDSMMRAVEYERSLLSDHELAHLADAERLREKQRAETDARGGKRAEDDEIVIETAKDRETRWAEEARRLTLGSRTTLADQQNNQQTLHRALDRKLYLVVKTQLGPTDSKWLFPQAPFDVTRDGSLRDTAENVLSTAFGKACLDKIQFLGNAPVGSYKYKYPKRSDARQQHMGAKIFFYHAQLLVPNADELFKLQATSATSTPRSSNSDNNGESSTILDYRWLTRNEMEREMQLKYFQNIDKFLFEFGFSQGSSTRRDGVINGEVDAAAVAEDDISAAAFPRELSRMRY